MGYRIGVDVGDRSVGLAAVEYDDAGQPVQVLTAVSHIHDGGMDPGTGQSPASRLATAGVARRARRLLRNRRRRLKRLDEVLVACGITVPDGVLRHTFEPWHARAELASVFVPDASERARMLGIAIRHLARHRGWRNPWWSYARLEQESTPSESFSALMSAAEARFGRPAGEWVSLGALVADVGDVSVAIRPRTKGKLALEDPGPVISQRLRQEDMLAELRLILATQEVPAEDAEAICEAVFEQGKPHVPPERVGRCALLTDLPRASMACLEFQEYRVRDAVANLRVRTGRNSARALTPEEHDLVVDRLLDWREVEPPRWADVADWLKVTPRELKQPDIDQGGGAVAPCDRTSRAIEAKFKASSDLGAWWRAASPTDRAEVAAILTDSITSTEEVSGAVAALVGEWSEDTQQALDTLELQSGRAAYSREALQRLLEVMRIRRGNAYSARSEAFGLPADWQPAPPTLEDPIEHPAVARVNVIVRRFLASAIQKWGLPDAVVVEHVRSAFLGPTARAEFERELRGNATRTDKVRQELTTQGVTEPSRSDVRRYECIQRQNGVCLYCGATIGMKDSQLDHIVADSRGGSNRRDNLVAVCAWCNGQKGTMPFAAWAARSPRAGVSVEDARQRLRDWTRHQMTAAQFTRLKRDVARRLGMTEDAEDIQDRSIESTAYAAREMRARIHGSVLAEAQRRGVDRDIPVQVYSGSVTSSARRAGGVDTALRIRGKDVKDRFDRRHHAIDAAVLTTLSPGVAVTLRTRQAMRLSDMYAGDAPGWKEYRGATPSEQANFGAWTTIIGTLAGLLRAEIDADRIAVVRPLRLTPRVGAVHKDTIEPLVFRSLAGEFTAEEILRVCDRRIFDALTSEAGGASVEADGQRPDRLGLPDDADIELYPSNAAYVRVRGGAAAIGDTIQHARVYAWPTKDGFGYGIVRAYTGEYPAIGFSKHGVDVLTAPLPHHSMAMRTANPALRERIATGHARLIGWLTINDEIEIDLDSLSRGSGKMGDFLTHLPEYRWTLTGFYDANTISLAPRLLALEGADDATPVAVTRILQANRIPLAANVILGGAGCTVIRRTVLGRPRWNHPHLPSSWSLREEAEKAFMQ